MTECPRRSAPPMGAPKAAATPAAAPHATKSRFSWSLRKGRNLLQVVSRPQEELLPCEERGVFLC